MESDRDVGGLQGVLKARVRSDGGRGGGKEREWRERRK